MSNKRPKEVLIFQEDEKALGYSYKLPNDFDMKNIDVKSIDYDVERAKKNYTLVGGSFYPAKDSVYYLHPYEKNTYIHESIGEDYFLKAKLGFYRKVGHLLGAKSIVTKVESIKREEREVNAKGECEYKVVKGSATADYTKEQKDKSLVEISDTYQLQDNFDLNKNIDELRKLIDELNLHHEIEIISLIDFRDSRVSGTILKERHVKSEITSEYNRTLDISVKLTHPVFSVSTEFKDRVKRVQTIMIDIKFEFY
jgi:hypothetical protein